ncbi:MAG: FAD:protein FMN transferase [Thermodesulfobacteriota bacterium]
MSFSKFWKRFFWSLKLLSLVFLWPSIILYALALAQNKDPHILQQSRIIMGTNVEILIAHTEPGQARAGLKEAFQEIEKIERLMSTYRSDSEVSKLNLQAGKSPCRVSPETLAVMERAIYFSRLSGGAFDVTITPLLRLWDFKLQRIPTAEEIKKAMEKIGYQKIKIKPASSEVFLADPEMAVDLGAIAKGYAVDQACAVLKKKGLANYLVNAGGDLRSQGGKGKGQPWIIGIKHPRLKDDLIAKVHLSGAALATSGDYEKFFIKNGERYHHLLDPSTGQPARKCQSVTVMAPCAMDADALATTLFILGPDLGLPLIAKLPDIHALIVDRRGRVLLSPNWPQGIIHPP